MVKKLSGSDNGSVSYEKAKGLAGLRRNMRLFLPEKIAKTRIPGVSTPSPQPAHHHAKIQPLFGTVQGQRLDDR